MAVLENSHFSTLGTYVDGFLAGQTAAYCEMVDKGVRLAGHIDCSADHKDAVLNLVAEEGCLALAIDRKDVARVSVWVYKHPRVEPLLRAIVESSDDPTILNVWASGKIFGYSDSEVVDFLSESTAPTSDTG